MQLSKDVYMFAICNLNINIPEPTRPDEVCEVAWANLGFEGPKSAEYTSLSLIGDPKSIRYRECHEMFLGLPADVDVELRGQIKCYQDPNLENIRHFIEDHSRFILEESLLNGKLVIFETPVLKAEVLTHGLDVTVSHELNLQYSFKGSVRLWLTKKTVPTDDYLLSTYGKAPVVIEQVKNHKTNFIDYVMRSDRVKMEYFPATRIRRWSAYVFTYIHDNYRDDVLAHAIKLMEADLNPNSLEQLALMVAKLRKMPPNGLIHSDRFFPDLKKNATNESVLAMMMSEEDKNAQAANNRKTQLAFLGEMLSKIPKPKSYNRFLYELCGSMLTDLILTDPLYVLKNFVFSSTAGEKDWNNPEKLDRRHFHIYELCQRAMTAVAIEDEDDE